MLSSELAVVLAFLLPFSELSTYHVGDQLLGLDERYLHVSMRITVERELASHTLWKSLEGLGILLAQMSEDILALCVLIKVLVVCAMSSQQVIKLLDEAADSRDELDEALRDKHHTEVVAILCTLSHCCSNLLNDLVQRHILLLDLLRDEADVRLCLECALQSDMRSGTTHELDEVPVFTGRVSITLDVTDKLRVNLCSSIETEAGLNLVVLQVAVDSLRAADDLHAILLSCIVLSEHASVGVGVITTNDDDSLDVELTDDLQSFLELIHLLKLCTARANHIKATGVTILVNKILCQFDIVVINQTTRTHEETVDLVVGVHLLHGIEDTANDVVTTRSLTTGKDDTDVHLTCCLFVTGDKLDERHSISVGEKLLDFFLITYALGRLSLLYFYGTLQTLGELGLVLCTCFLQKTCLH